MFVNLLDQFKVQRFHKSVFQWPRNSVYAA